MSDLLLVTHEFPFGSGEPFLEAEIEILSNSFDTIFIFATNGYGKVNRILPENVCVYGAEHYEIERIKGRKYNFVFERLVWKELITNFNSWYKLKVAIKELLIASKYSKKIEAIVKANSNISLVYAYWFNYIALCANLVGRSKRRPTVCRAHGSDLYEYIHKKGYLPFRIYNLHTSKNISCISKHGYNYLRTRYPKYSKKIVCHYLGTNNELDCSYSPDSILNLLSCSHINPGKRLDLMIHGLTGLNIEVNWTHIGYGYEYNERPIFELSKRLLSNSTIKFEFLGYMPHNKLMHHYANHTYDLFINVSSSEGLPVSMMEAMSFGIPCVGTDVGGVSEIIKDGYNGFLLPSNPSPEQITKCISVFESLSLDHKATLSNNARKTWEANFSAKQNYSMFSAFIRSLITQSKS